MIGIYKITNPINEVYIGQSTDIKTRIWAHNFIKKRRDSNLLNNSLMKYGKSNHIFEAIEECDILELNERERYWQDFYNLSHRLLNMHFTKTADKKGYKTEEAKALLRVHKIMKREKYVLDTQFGIYYTTIYEASLSNAYCDGTIRKMLLGLRKNKTNLILV